MTANTIAANRERHPLDADRPVWLFGYGSLIFKADFPYLERHAATIEGWQRRFWQGSHDHRGTADAPGRVATLIESPGSHCKGMAYRVSPDVFDHLDVREKNGYLRFMTPMRFDDDSFREGLVYIATEDNSAFLGPADELTIARQIAASEGPSGPNDAYLLKLAEALRELGENDPHVYAIEKHLLADY